MDTDELDRWLESDDDDEGAGPAAAWPAAGQGPSEGRRSRGRPRWLVPAGAAVAVWLAVMGVLLLGGEADTADGGNAAGDPATPAEIEPATDLAAGDLAAGDQAAEDVATEDMSAGDVATEDMSAEGAAIGAVTADPGDGAPDGVGSPGPDPATGDGPATPPDDGPLHGAAVSALRAQLTGSAEGRDRYLEHATPVEVRALGEAVVVVLLDAVWLEGVDGQLTEVHQGRWSVPMAEDGTPLGAAWQVAGAPTPPAPAVDPPLGTLRLPEVEQAMLATGWTEVVAAAADPHPFLDDVVVALVQGISPSGGARAGDVVWLTASDAGLVLLGAAS